MARKRRGKGAEYGADFALTTRPVGQVVKTAASHAVNIGSNPVRVTTQKQALDHETDGLKFSLTSSGIGATIQYGF